MFPTFCISFCHKSINSWFTCYVCYLSSFFPVCWHSRHNSPWRLQRFNKLLVYLLCLFLILFSLACRACYHAGFFWLYCGVRYSKADLPRIRSLSHFIIGLSNGNANQLMLSCEMECRNITFLQRDQISVADTWFVQQKDIQNAWT